MKKLEKMKRDSLYIQPAQMPTGPPASQTITRACAKCATRRNHHALIEFIRDEKGVAIYEYAWRDVEGQQQGEEDKYEGVEGVQQGLETQLRIGEI